MPWDNNRATHVPTPIRNACLKRDGNRCTATLHTGGRCTETTQLEAAHINSWHQGEHITVNMVRTLCHWHHNRETQAEAQAARRPRPTSNRPAEQHPAFRTRKQ